MAELGGEVVGHLLIEPANPEHEPAWRAALGSEYDQRHLIEIGGAFVDPVHFNQGIFSQLLRHAITQISSEYGAIPVFATWSDNPAVIHKLGSLGAVHAGSARVPGGQVELFALKPQS